MDIICFVPTVKYLNDVTSTIGNDLSRDDHFETYKTLDVFFERIHLPKKIPTIIIFCAENIQDFKKMLPYKKFLNDTQNILVLPDRRKKTIDTALVFCPRFYIFEDQDFKPINDVVDKMRQNFSSKKAFYK